MSTYGSEMRESLEALSTAIKNCLAKNDPASFYPGGALFFQNVTAVIRDPEFIMALIELKLLIPDMSEAGDFIVEDLYYQEENK